MVCEYRPRNVFEREKNKKQKNREIGKDERTIIKSSTKFINVCIKIVYTVNVLSVLSFKCNYM